MNDQGWLPVQEDIIEGAISCAWADGQGGELDCPAGTTDCAVNYLGNGTFEIVCVNESWEILDNGLQRTLF